MASNAQKILGRLCATVEATGGIQYGPALSPSLVVEPEWLDLADLYVQATRELGISIRGNYNKVEHVILPDGTVLVKGVLSQVRHLLASMQEDEARRHLTTVMQAFLLGDDPNTFKFIIRACRDMREPPYELVSCLCQPIDPTATTDLVSYSRTPIGHTVPPDLVLLDIQPELLDAVETNNVMNIDWYHPAASEHPGMEGWLLASRNSLAACIPWQTDFREIRDSLMLDLKFVWYVEPNTKVIRNGEFATT